MASPASTSFAARHFLYPHPDHRTGDGLREWRPFIVRYVLPGPQQPHLPVPGHQPPDPQHRDGRPQEGKEANATSWPGPYLRMRVISSSHSSRAPPAERSTMTRSRRTEPPSHRRPAISNSSSLRCGHQAGLPPRSRATSFTIARANVGRSSRLGSGIRTIRSRSRSGPCSFESSFAVRKKLTCDRSHSNSIKGSGYRADVSTSRNGNQLRVRGCRCAVTDPAFIDFVDQHGRRWP